MAIYNSHYQLITLLYQQTDYPSQQSLLSIVRLADHLPWLSLIWHLYDHYDVYFIAQVAS